MSLIENNISIIIKEREEAQPSRVYMEDELKKVKEDITLQISKFIKVYRTL